MLAFDPSKGNFFDLLYVKWSFMFLLCSIQILQLIWFWYIYYYLRQIASIAKKVVFDKEKIYDDQSDDEKND